MCKPFGIGNLLSFGIKHLNEVATDDFALLFGIGNACQISKELLAGIYTNHIQAKHLVVFHHLRELIFAEHTMIDKDTGQLIANGTIEKYGSNG